MIDDLYATQYLTFEVIIWIPSRECSCNCYAISNANISLYCYLIIFCIFICKLVTQSLSNNVPTPLSPPLSLPFNFKRFYNANCEEDRHKRLGGVPNNSFYMKLICYVSAESITRRSVYNCQ